MNAVKQQRIDFLFQHAFLLLFSESDYVGVVNRRHGGECSDNTTAQPTCLLQAECYLRSAHHVNWTVYSSSWPRLLWVSPEMHKLQCKWEMAFLSHWNLADIAAVRTLRQYSSDVPLAFTLGFLLFRSSPCIIRTRDGIYREQTCKQILKTSSAGIWQHTSLSSTTV